MDKPKYIFQLTAEDIAKMLAAGNARAGWGVKVEIEGGVMVISLDPDVIVDCMWSFVRSGEVLEGLSRAPCVVRSNIKDTRGCVVLDPNYYE
jgi:hypothetical protein